jgi:hypothetical protein
MSFGLHALDKRGLSLLKLLALPLHKAAPTDDTVGRDGGGPVELSRESFKFHPSPSAPD